MHRACKAAIGTADIWQAEDEDEFFRNSNMTGDRQTDGEAEHGVPQDVTHVLLYNQSILGRNITPSLQQ